MRALVVFSRLLPFMLAFMWDRRRFLVVGRPRRRDAERHRRRAERLTETLAELGPTFIKLAQVFSARADILPEPYLSAIGTLTDRVPPLPPGVAERVVREDLGVSFRILFVLNLLFPNHHTRAITAIVSEFAKRIRDELDFREEARNAAMLRRNFQNEPRVVVPEVVTELVTRRVLVLEYVEGTRIDRLHDRLASGELDLQRLVETVVDAYIKMMLEDGVFH